MRNKSIFLVLTFFISFFLGAQAEEIPQPPMDTKTKSLAKTWSMSDDEFSSSSTETGGPNIELHSSSLEKYPKAHLETELAEIDADLSRKAMMFAEQMRQLDYSIDDAHANLQNSVARANINSAGIVYEPTITEIREVHSYLRSRGISLPEAEIELAAKYWYKGQTVEARGREAVTLGAITAAAALGAAKGYIVYYIDTRLGEEEFNCLGISKAVTLGAARGVMALAFWGVKAAEEVLDFADVAELCGVIGTVVESTLEVPKYEFMLLSCGGTSIALNWLNELIDDIVWGVSPIRTTAVAFCSFTDSDEIRRGGLLGVRSWAENELVPTFIDEYGLDFLLIQSEIDSHLSASGTDAQGVPRVSGELELNRSDGRTAVLLLASETVSWRSAVQPNRPGSYVARLKVLRNGNDFGTVDEINFTSASNQPVEINGVFDASIAFASAGTVEGAHELRLELENLSEGWTSWLIDGQGAADKYDVEIRTNRKPYVSMQCLPLLGLAKCDIFVLDPDGLRPESLVFWLDSNSIDLTSELPASGVDWTEGYTIVRNFTNLPQGVYSIRAQVEDSEFIVFSGPPRDLRIGSLPFPEFPPVALGNVGESARYSARWLDSISGISGKDIYVESDKLGTFRSTDGELANSFVTDAGGWAEFDYTPLETGRHTLTIWIDDIDISQTSNIVDPGCAPPDEPSLQDPGNGSQNVPIETFLEWRTRDDVAFYELYFGLTEPLSLEATYAYQNDNIFHAIGPLQEGTEYLWRVVAAGECDSNQKSISDTRRFFTLGSPEPVVLLTPSNASEEQATSLLLDWANVSTPGTFVYDLYFGTTSTPPFFEFMGTTTERLVQALEPDTTYFWRVEARSPEDPTLSSTSAVWEFTTGSTAATTIQIKASRDATVRAGSFANQNYGGQFGSNAGEDRNLILGTGDDLFSDPGDETSRALVFFDLAPIPSGSNIVNATMTLELGGRNGGSPGVDLDFPIDPLQSNWGEQTVTWNNVPTVNTSHRVLGTIPQSGWGTLQTNLTPLIQKWLDGTVANFGARLSIPAYEGNAGKFFHWAQREFDANETWAPNLEVTFAPPCVISSAPVLDSPVQDAVDLPDSLSLTWQSVADASGYRVYFGDVNPPPELGLTSETSISVSGLDRDVNYFWRVEALAECDAGVTASSETRSFRTSSCLTPDPPLLIAPDDGTSGQSAAVELSWSGAEGADSYDILAGTANPPSTLVGSTADTTFIMTALAGRSYHWRVLSRADCDASLTAASGVFSFETAQGPQAFAGSDKQGVVDQSIDIGGDPTATNGTPPYTYEWAITSGVASVLSNSSLANPSITVFEDGSVVVQAIVTDSLGFVARDFVRVTVSDPDLIFKSSFE